MCHESYSFDAQSGNSIDLKVMIHKIHSGETLPSVEAGGFYGIFGFGNTFTDFSEVVYPQDKRNCTTCHEESDTDTPQASNWRVTVNTATCASCHDNVNFVTGENHGGVAATDDTCTACHGPNSDARQPARRRRRTSIPEHEAAKRFKFEVVKVRHQASTVRRAPPPARPRDRVHGPAGRVPDWSRSRSATRRQARRTDHGPGVHERHPVHAGAAGRDLQRDAARLHARVAYTTTNFTQPGERRTPAQPIRSTSRPTAAAPTGAPARRAACHAERRRFLQQGGREAAAGRAHRRLGRGAPRRPPDRRRQRRRRRREYAEIGVTSSAGVTFAITDAAPVPRRADRRRRSAATTATSSSRSTATIATTTPSCARPATTRMRRTSIARRARAARPSPAR